MVPATTVDLAPRYARAAILRGAAPVRRSPASHDCDRRFYPAPPAPTVDRFEANRTPAAYRHPVPAHRAAQSAGQFLLGAPPKSQ